MKPYKVTAFDLKLALLQRFRFRYGWVCCTEFQGADVIADTGKEIIEVEVKVTKSDLIGGERRKIRKHKYLKSGMMGYRLPNRFFFAVPSDLVEVAKDWVGELNTDYGIFEFCTGEFISAISRNRGMREHMEFLYQVKRANQLRIAYHPGHQFAIAKRAVSELTGFMKSNFRAELNRLMEVSNA